LSTTTGWLVGAAGSPRAVGGAARAGMLTDCPPDTGATGRCVGRGMPLPVAGRAALADGGAVAGAGGGMLGRSETARCSGTAGPE